MGIVRIVSPTLSIKTLASKKLRLLDEQDVQIGVHFQVTHAALDKVSTHPDLEVPVHESGLRKVQLTRLVKRRHHGNAMPLTRQRLCQCPDHVSKAAGLGVWKTLPGDLHDVHRSGKASC